MSLPSGWDYEHYQGYREFIRVRRNKLLKDLFSNRTNIIASVTDTRPVHDFMFNGLTPSGMEYFAGNYRGAKYKELEKYEVRIGGSRGTDSHLVEHEMEALAQEIIRGFQALNTAANTLSATGMLYSTVAFAAAISVNFLMIHPFANGNGHISRYIVEAILHNYGYRPKKHWRIDPRPEDPYSQCVWLHVHGDRAPLEKFILNCIIG